MTRTRTPEDELFERLGAVLAGYVAEGHDASAIAAASSDAASVFSGLTLLDAEATAGQLRAASMRTTHYRAQLRSRGGGS
jgi:hypothetical protein